MVRQRIYLILFFSCAFLFANDENLSELKEHFKSPTEIPFPKENPFSESKYTLGKILFFDPRLSQSKTISCATCHNPNLSWFDGRARGIGESRKPLRRKTPTILNSALGWSFFWDGRAATLEEQALGPIQSPDEMNLKLSELENRIRAIKEYQPYFSEAFPNEPITAQTIAKAIATFERTILSSNAPFDRWIEGDEKAISESAKRGFILFNGKAACVKCHTGWGFTNGSFADTGLKSNDNGRADVTGNKHLRHTFKTPTLRNIATRAPYMHDGSLKNLKAVIAHYNSGGVSRSTSSLFVKKIGLSPLEIGDLISFLETLSSPNEIFVPPTLPKGD